MTLGSAIVVLPVAAFALFSLAAAIGEFIFGIPIAEHIPNACVCGGCGGMGSLHLWVGDWQG